MSKFQNVRKDDGCKVFVGTSCVGIWDFFLCKKSKGHLKDRYFNKRLFSYREFESCKVGDYYPPGN